jgi:hypothetical protein
MLPRECPITDAGITSQLRHNASNAVIKENETG